jgi:bacillopeptidase F
LVFDNEAPEIKILSPSDGASFYGSKQKNVTINGTTKIDSSLTINDRIATVNDDGGFSLNYSLSNGENNLAIKSIDKAGNEKEINLKLFFSE